MNYGVVVPAVVAALGLGTVVGGGAYKAAEVESHLAPQIAQLKEKSKGKLEVEYGSVSAPIYSSEITLSDVVFKVKKDAEAAPVSVFVDNISVEGDYVSAFENKTLPNDIELTVNGLLLTKDNWSVISGKSEKRSARQWESVFGTELSEIKGGFEIASHKEANGHSGSMGLSVNSIGGSKLAWKVSGLPESVDKNTNIFALLAMLSKVKLHHLSVEASNDGFIDKRLSEIATEKEMTLSDLKKEGKTEIASSLDYATSSMVKKLNMSEDDASKVLNKEVILSLIDDFKDISFAVSYEPGFSFEDSNKLSKINSYNSSRRAEGFEFLTTMLKDVEFEVKANGSDVVDVDIAKRTIRDMSQKLQEK